MINNPINHNQQYQKCFNVFIGSVANIFALKQEWFGIYFRYK